MVKFEKIQQTTTGNKITLHIAYFVFLNMYFVNLHFKYCPCLPVPCMFDLYLFKFNPFFYQTLMSAYWAWTIAIIAEQTVQIFLEDSAAVANLDTLEMELHVQVEYKISEIILYSGRV